MTVIRNPYFSTVPKLLGQGPPNTSIKGERLTSSKVARMPTRWKLVPVVPGRKTAVCCDIMPLKQNKISAHSRRKLEPVLIIPKPRTITCLRSRRCRRNVGPFGIIWVEVGPMSRYEPQLACIKAGLCRLLARRDRTCFERKVPLMMRRQCDREVDCLSRSVGSLDLRTLILVVIPTSRGSATSFP